MLNVSPTASGFSNRQQHRVDQVVDVRVVEHPVAAADELHLAGLNFFDDPRQRVPIAGPVDEPGPQDHGRKVVLLM